MKEVEPYIQITAKHEGFIFTKTLPFTKYGLQKTRELIEFLEKQLEEKRRLKP